MPRVCCGSIGDEEEEHVGDPRDPHILGAEIKEMPLE